MHAAALAALAPMLPLSLRAETAPRLWPRYRDVIAIDGEGGLELLRGRIQAEHHDAAAPRIVGGDHRLDLSPGLR